MTRFSEVALRYASALFELAKEEGKVAAYGEALESIANGLFADTAASAFFRSPLVLPAEKESVVTKTIAPLKLPQHLEKFILLLTQKGRLPLLSEIATAYRAREDDENKIIRGVVRAATTLSDSQKAEVERVISSKAGKNVVLTFEQDPGLIGGVSAQVGSLGFDDAISAHLTKMKDDLTRSLH